MAKQQGTDLESIRSSGGSDKKVSMAERVTQLKFAEKKWTVLRLYGSAYSYGGYWVTTKKKDGSKTNFYTDCPSYDPVTQQRDSTIYDPWREIEASEQDVKPENKTVKFSRTVYFNGIFRSAQKQEPSKKARQTKTETASGIKEKDSDSWTPVYACRFTASVAAKIKEQSGLNVVEIKGQTKPFAVTHEKYGCDIRIFYDKTKAPADQYQISIGDRTPITEDEKAYLIQDLSELVDDVSPDEVKRDFENWATRNGVKVKAKKVSEEEFDDSDSDEDDEEDEAPKKKAKPVAKSKAKVVEEEDDEDDSDDEGFDDDDEDEEPAPKSKKPVAKAKAKVVEEDDDDFDEEEDDEEEEAPKSKAKAKPVAKKKPVVEESDDDDDFDEDDEEDEPAPVAKKKAKAKVVEDDEESDDDFDDEPVAKKSKAKAPIAKAKAKVVEEDEDDEDSDDLDDDDEEPAPKSKKPVAKVVAKKKAKPVVEDDDDDDFDD